MEIFVHDIQIYNMWYIYSIIYFYIQKNKDYFNMHNYIEPKNTIRNCEGDRHLLST